MSDERHIIVKGLLAPEIGGVAAPSGDAANAPRVDDAAVAPVFTVRFFGSFQVIAPDGGNATPGGRKARALLAHLLLAGGEGMPRERLAALLWSQRGPDQARASLRQTLYEMRELTAGDAPLLVFDRTQARIAVERVRSDLDALRAAAQEGDAAALAEQVGERPRDFLIDLEAIDDGFDEWLARERVRRADERRGLLLAAGEAALGRGDAPAAQTLAGLLLAIDPTDERGARLSMAASAQRGDRDTLRQTFARLEQSLWTELRSKPTDETVELHRSLQVENRAPAAIPDLPAPVDPVAVDADADAQALPERPPVDAPVSTQPPVAPRRVARRRAVAAVALLAAGVVGAALWLKPSATVGPRVLMVRPLDVPAGDADSQALARGLAVQLARMIVGNDARLSVVGPQGAAVAGAAAQRVDFFVSGDAQASGAVLHANVKITHGGDPTILWGASFTRPVGEADALREQITTRVADVVVCALGGRNPSIEELGVETLRLYMSACEQKHGDWSESAKLLQQVVARKPDFAHGWAMLAAGTATAAYQRPEEADALHRQAEVYAQRALAIDPRDGEAYYARAESMPGLAHWSRRMAVLEAGHAVDPTNAPTNVMIAYCLAQVGRWREARVYSQQALQFDPFSAGQTQTLAYLTGFGGDPEQANALLATGRKRFPDSIGLARSELRLATYVGDPQRAVALLADPGRSLRMSSAETGIWRAMVDARIDPSAASRERAARSVVANLETPEGGGLWAVEKLVVLGRIDDAFAVADKLAGRPDLPSQSLFASTLAPLRADPRFMTLAARIGLVQVWQETRRWPDFCAEPMLPYDCRVEADRAAAGVPAAR